MKTNEELGYGEVARVGDYNVGRKFSDQWRAYGYELRLQDQLLEEMAELV